ncbi:hypothetical protein EUGRSUZ_L00150 [Eucalyptus grandis]|uniref:Fe2OG dioxygenase domain-containing protein n=3 Tax=Eucalyptus grandis TaxID=71139 RepID=A0A058ZX39_EUCGR|nr:hypothetical protein EUGRSUZ_L00150 [Eucalyptus grandis]KAK3433612.1 hypothetical protein EUGRSUZ_L00150 [Eucalyptus grandis]
MLYRRCWSDRIGVQWISTTCLLVGRLSLAQGNLGGVSFLKVHNALPGSKFNSLLLNRYKGGNDYVGWHSDDEKLYGSTPEIASVSFGCEREFFLKKKPSKNSQARRPDDEPVRKRSKMGGDADQHTFVLKHGSLLVMRGYTQRDWIHSVPKRAKAEGLRINLTFRRIIS